MPLSDDELRELEAHYRNDRVGFDILALQRNDKVLGLIAEIRISRKTIITAAYASDAYKRADECFGIDPQMSELKSALHEYEAALAQPTSHPSKA